MPNKSFAEDMTALAAGLLNNLMESRHEIKAQARQRAGSVARGLDLVTRDEFDAAFAMLAKARDAQEDIRDRLQKIESHLGLSRAKAAARKPVKTARKNLPSVKTNKAGRSRGKTAKPR